MYSCIPTNRRIYQENMTLYILSQSIRQYVRSEFKSISRLRYIFIFSSIFPWHILHNIGIIVVCVGGSHNK